MRITRRHLDPPIAAEPQARPGRRITLLFVVLLAGSLLIALLVAGGRWGARSEPPPERSVVGDLFQSLLPRVRAWTAPGRAPALSVDVAFDDYQRLVTARERALTRGAHVASASSYVDVRLTLDGRTSEAALTLEEGRAASLEGEDRWPFQGVIAAGEAISGAHAFRLAPAERGTPRAWGYLHALRRSGLPAARVTLVRLWVNGDDWGLYVLETLPPLPADPSATPIVVAFDPSAFFDAGDGEGALGMGSGIRYARIATFRGWGLALDAQAESFEDDPALAAAHAAWVARFDAVATGAVEPAAIFDVEGMGRHLALTTLWYGTPALDWRELSLLVDAESDSLMPVGSRDSARTEGITDPLGYLDDPQIQRAYLLALQEMAEPAYLSALRAEVAPRWTDQGWSASGLGSLDAMWDALRRNQAHIRRMLAPARTLYADAGEDTDVLVLRLRNVQPFPVEVLGLELGGETFLPLQQAWIPAEDRAWLAVPHQARVILRARWDRMAPVIDVRVPLSALPIVMEGREDEIRVITRLWGLEAQQLVMPVRESYSLSGGGF